MTSYSHLFPPTISPVVYLDSSSTTQLPSMVLSGITNHLSGLQVNSGRSNYIQSANLSLDLESARDKLSTFVTSHHSREIIFTSGASESSNLVVTCWAKPNLTPSEEIILLSTDHLSLVGPWLYTFPNQIKLARISQSGCWDLDHFKKIYSPRVKVVVISHIHNTYGTKNDIDQIRKIIGDNCVIVVDCSQSIGRTAVSVQDLQADFIIFSGHKMFALSGTGILWINQKLHPFITPSQIGSNNASLLSSGQISLRPVPQLLEVGTKNIPGILSLGLAVDFINSVGLEKISYHLLDLTQYALECLRKYPQINFLPGPAHCHCAVGYGLISFYIAGISSEDVGFILGQNHIAVRTGFHCSGTIGSELESVRLSLHINNTREDIDILDTTIAKIISKLP